jgi:hypothetical protein
MADKKKRDLIFAVSDIIIGAAAVIMFICGRFFSSYVMALPFFSTPFLISLALPAFVLLAGIASLARISFAPMTTLFASFLVSVNSLALLFSYDRPLFLNQGAPPHLIAFFKTIIPIAAVVYFCVRAVVALLEVKRNASSEGHHKEKPPLPVDDFYCASCGERLHPDNDMCPSCKTLIRGHHCTSCGYEGRESDFIDGQCPRCGKTDETED